MNFQRFAIPSLFFLAYCQVHDTLWFTHTFFAKILGCVKDTILHLLQELGGGNSNIFYVHPRKLGKIPILTFIFFQMGWFNHQPENLVNNGINYLPTGAGVLPSTVSYLSKLGGSKNDL